LRLQKYGITSKKLTIFEKEVNVSKPHLKILLWKILGGY